MNSSKLEIKSDNINIQIDSSTFCLFDSSILKLVCDTNKVHNYLKQGLIGEYVFSDSVIEYYLQCLITAYINGCVEEYILEHNDILKDNNIEIQYIANHSVLCQ